MPSGYVKYKNYFEFNDRYYFHPGYYIEELIESLDLSRADFAFEMGMNEKAADLLINGRQSLTADLATKLSRLTGTSSGLWMGYQARYDEAVAKLISQDLPPESDRTV